MYDKQLKICTLIFITLTTILFIGAYNISKISILLILYINILILTFLCYKKYDLKIIYLIIFQWLIYIIFLIIHKYFIDLIGSGNDDIRFEKLAINYYNYYLYGIEPNIFQSSTLYSHILGIFYYFGGYQVLVPGLLNITIHSLTIILLYNIYVLVLKTVNGALLTCIIYTIYPLTMFNTIITLREIIIILFLMLFVYTFLLFYVYRNWGFLILSILSLGLGSLFHIGFIGFFLFYAIYILVFSNFNSVLKILLSSIFLLILKVYINTTENSKIVSNIDPKTKDFDGNSSRADYLKHEATSGFINDLIFKVKQEIYFMFKPFFWEIRNFADLLGFFNVFFILLGILIAVYVYRKTNNKRIIILLTMILTFYFVFALGTYNYGTALRHRDKASMLLTLYIPYFYYFKLKKRKAIVYKK